MTLRQQHLPVRVVQPLKTLQSPTVELTLAGLVAVLRAVQEAVQQALP